METDIATTNYLTSKKKINDVLALDKITFSDIECFSKIERDYFQEITTEMLHNLAGEEKNQLFNKIEGIVDANTKSQFWEKNHHLITGTIEKLMLENGYMPSTNAISAITGLSRQTVAKHLKEYRTRPEYIEEIDRFKSMTSRVLANVFKSVSKGDMRAARLYLDTFGETDKKSSGGMVVNEQNNYIQVNNTILSQENLKNLSAEQLNQIELIVTGVSK